VTRSRITTFAVIAGLAWAIWLPSSARAGGSATTVDIAGNGIGVPPADFDFWRTGGGEVGRWAVVRDATAANGAAIEQFSTDPTENRFPLAIYKPASLKNVAFKTRFKIVSGAMLSAGIAVRLLSYEQYYVVTASALESRVDLYRVDGGTKDRIAGVDADVERDHWHTLEVKVDNDAFTVTLDNRSLFTAWDRTLLRDGHVALWTEEDTVARFEQIEITPLPWSETR
jgi:hypothetical protein